MTFPECTVCKQPFRWKGPDPYLLPCLHAVCETCLTSAEGGIHCSTCQKDADLENTKLQLDGVRKRLVLHLTAKHRPTEVLCTHSDDGNQAVCWCQECEEFLCEHCQNMHEEFKATRRHEVQGISEIGTSEAEEESYCSVHKRHVLELMDHDCGVLVCYKCKHEEHSGHDIEDITAVTQATKQELQEHMRAVADVNNKIQERFDSLRLEEASYLQKERIGHTFDALASLVRQRQKEVTLEFDALFDKARTSHSEERLTLKQHQCELSNIMKYTQTVLDHATRSDLPVTAARIRDAVKECLSSELLEKEQMVLSVTFVNEDLSEMKKAISTFSGISVKGEKSTSEVRNRPQRTFEELQEKCEALEVEVAILKETIDSLKKEKMTFAGADNSLLPTERPYLGSNPYGSFHLLRPADDSRGPIKLNCIELKFNTNIANLNTVHINADGELCNKPKGSRRGGRRGRLRKYDGTSTTDPLLQADYLQYWETFATARLHELVSMKELFLEIGVCWETERDNKHCITGELHGYSMHLYRCDMHNSICTKLNKGGEYMFCLPNAFSHRPGITNTFHYGVVFDYTRRKLAYLDVKEMTVIAVLDNVDTSQPLWPMFGVYNPHRGLIKMRLMTGEDIHMTTEKKDLILKALY